MTPVFLDTVGLIASWDTSDQWHSLARPVLNQLTLERRPLLTTTFVLLECGNAAARRPYRSTVNTLRQALERDGRLVAPTDDDHNKHGVRTMPTSEAAQASSITFHSSSCAAFG